MYLSPKKCNKKKKTKQKIEPLVLFSLFLAFHEFKSPTSRVSLYTPLITFCYINLFTLYKYTKFKIRKNKILTWCTIIDGL